MSFGESVFLGELRSVEDCSGIVDSSPVIVAPKRYPLVGADGEVVGCSEQPLNYQMFGADANQIAPAELLDQGIKTLLNDLGVPLELFTAVPGGSQKAGVNEALRLLPLIGIDGAPLKAEPAKEYELEFFAYATFGYALPSLETPVKLQTTFDAAAVRLRKLADHADAIQAAAQALLDAREPFVVSHGPKGSPTYVENLCCPFCDSDSPDSQHAEWKDVPHKEGCVRKALEDLLAVDLAGL